MDDTALARACRQEIASLHRFFTAWLRGELPDTDGAWARVEEVLAPAFVLVTPEGRRWERAMLLEDLRRAHGARPDLTIHVRRFTGRTVAAGTVLATYEEWQHEKAADRGRISTALFAEDRGAPGGVRWLHVHETWLPRAD